MKKLLIIIFTSLVYGCTQPVPAPQVEMETEHEAEHEQYKSGMGEMMVSIQVRHSKLWFAGINSNWKLAQFEVEEIREALEDIQKFNSERVESQSVPMLFAALDSMEVVIKNQNTEQFKNGFVNLTNTCNSCHRATNFEFNVIKIPDTPPFSNQEFKPIENK